MFLGGMILTHRWFLQTGLVKAIFIPLVVLSFPLLAFSILGAMSRISWSSGWLESSKHIIGMVEMYGALVARTVWASILAGRKSILFVDNNAAKEAFVKGTSYNKHYRQMLVSLEQLESESRSWTWVARAPSHSNPADEPSRGIHTGIVSVLNATQVSCTCPLTNCILDVYRTD